MAEGEIRVKKVTVVGLGAGELAQLSIGTYQVLKKASPLFIRTEKHPVVEELKKEGMTYQSFDAEYEKHERFEEVYRSIVNILLAELDSQQEITYAVPGHPLVAEETVQLLLKEGKARNIQIDIQGGQSFLDPMFNALKIDPIDGCQIVDGTQLKRQQLQIRQHMIICQVYDAFIASEVKLTLMDLLPDDYEVKVATAVGTTMESIITCPLYELDRVTELNNLTAVYVPPVVKDQLLYRDFQKLREVIATLRGPEGCPWDQEQTHQSLKPFLLEEAYEVLEAIDEQDDDHLVEELGDVLLQVMLHAQIGEDDGWFTIDDVIYSVTEKMIRRHPHVFSNQTAKNSAEVIVNWEEIKKKEKNGKETESVLDGIPKSMPALMKAFEIQKKAAKVGFDWDDAAPMWMKLQEEISEFFSELKIKNEEKMKKEFGDILFVFINLARYYKINPEEALHMTNQKFSSRFQAIEEELAKQGLTFAEVTLEQMDEIWEKSKEKYQ
ncbi:nucleoside triphosphate pyrophosphohydrolase [Alkalihalobacillus sp. BA299]|uniref:nucleoside triphosphate pyrophosphohydrolase n=1 Tax=Alkalihalobacillus sp. BA299 TaxID=2815938 RepID=UPI001ADC15E3|nr:nucleoside triphosphate pyrophosphohydrolase [Alkalihalobacillus sp. BA299]